MYMHILLLQMSVCLFGTCQYCVETAIHNITLYSPSGSHTILVFTYQMIRQYSDGDPLLGHQIQVMYEKIAHFDPYLTLSGN